MTIGVNGNEANVKTRVGVGQYVFELLKHLSKLRISDLEFRIYLSRPPLPDMPKHFIYKVFGSSRLWTLTSLQKKLLEEKMQGTIPDVFFTPTHYAPLYVPTRSVVGIMDLAFEKFKEYYKTRDLLRLKYWTQASIMAADKIITISEHTKKDLCSLCAVSPGKVVVTYPGYDKERFNEKVKPDKKITKRPYFVFLGTLQPRKNLIRLIEAFSKLEPIYDLIIIGMITEGRGGWKYQPIFAKVAELGLKNRVIFTGYLPDDDIPGVFKGAIAYVLPSLYEGFGIPPIEAMACGVPVIVSKVSSLPEICGPAATYIENPYDTNSILKSLQDQVLQIPSERAKQIQLSLEWVKRYNWEDTAKKTLEVLTHV